MIISDSRDVYMMGTRLSSSVIRSTLTLKVSHFKRFTPHILSCCFRFAKKTVKITVKHKESPIISSKSKNRKAREWKQVSHYLIRECVIFFLRCWVPNHPPFVGVQ